MIIINSLPELKLKIGKDDLVVVSNIYRIIDNVRAQILLENNLKVDLAVIDEAQNVSDRSRGIIL